MALKRIVLFVLVFGIPLSHAAAAETTGIQFEGNFDSSSSVSSPPSTPASFSELDASAFLALTTSVTDSGQNPRSIRFFFWRSAARAISVRVYIDSVLAGGIAGVPGLVGAGELAFNNDGTKQLSESTSDLVIQVNWAGDTTSRVNVLFNLTTLVGEASTLAVVPVTSGKGHSIDIDRDGIDDLAIYRPHLGLWAVKSSSSPQSVFFRQWGLPNDVPLVGDYTGDGRADLVVWRPSNGNWYICKSDTNLDCFGTDGNVTYQFGLQSDRPIKADYDHDGILDLAVWRPEFGLFISRDSSSGSVRVNQWGLPTDIPIQTGVNR